jgi:nucleotide-binding universal stress UspA family protein
MELTVKPGLLITTNGYKATWAGIEYGAWFAEAMGMKVTLLGVNERFDSEPMDDYYSLEDIFNRAGELFKQKGIEYSFEIQDGKVEDVIPEKANKSDFIIVVSPFGRSQIQRFFVGRSIRPLMERIKDPILYVPEVRLPLKKVLIGAGGLGYEVEAENLAFQVAAMSQAEVAILHVVPPTDLDYPTTRDVLDHLDDLAETDTLLGRSLRKGLGVAKLAGLNAKAISRQGNIVEEILAEIKEGNYDLVCMGSPYSAHTLRQFFAPNVTAEVAVATPCPVLTARHVSA